MRKAVYFVFSLGVLLSLGANCVPAAVTIDSATREAQARTPFAINGTKVFHIPDQLDTTVSKRLGWMRELGVLWDRSDWWWHIIEPERGQFDFSLPDRIVKHFEANDVQIYPILSYGAAWFEEGKTAPITAEEREAFAAYVYKTVDRYKDHFTYWSVWNEPNILPFWSPEPNADDYAALLKAAYKAAKRADPDCKICAPVVAPLQGFDRKFVERLYQLGCKDYFDVFDYHYYRSGDPEDEVPEEIADIRALMRRYGDDKPIWLSETGVPSPIRKKPESYERQAALVVRNHLLCLASGVERIFYFDLQNWKDDPGSSWDSFLGLVEAGEAKKPAFRAYQTMVKEVGDRPVLGRCRNLGRGVESVLIHDPARDEYSLAVWLRKAGKKKKVDVVCDPVDVKIVHPYGEIEMRPLLRPPLPGQSSRILSLEVDQRPLFVHSVHKNAYLPQVAVRLVPEKMEATAGGQHELRLEIDPALDLEGRVEIRPQLPDGIEWNPQTGKLSVRENLAPGEKEIRAEILLTPGGKGQRQTLRLERTAKVIFLPSLSLALRPYGEDGELKVQATLGNQSSRSISGRIRLEETAAGQTRTIAETARRKLPARQKKRFDLSVEPQTIQSYRQSAIWRLKFAEAGSNPFRVYPALLSAQGPEIDGRLDEWRGLPKLALDHPSQIIRGGEGWGPAECFAEVSLWFTPESVCIGAWVKDDDPMHNPHPPNLLWKGDALELYLGFQGPAKRTVINKAHEFQIGIAPNCSLGRPIVFLFHEDRILNSAAVAAQKTEMGYTLEAAIPLSEFGESANALNKGILLGFDVALDDLDAGDWAPEGNDPGRALMWNGTGMNWIDPSGWGMAVLSDLSPSPPSLK